jgi:hypothetical protein
VRGDDHLVTGEERIAVIRWFAFENIEGGPGQAPADDGLSQGGLVDDPAP